MATADTARLIATLELQDKFTKTADRAIGKVDRIDKKLGAFSGAANRNLSRAVDATISRGVRALTSSVTEGLGSLAELENATTAVDGAIAATGKTGKVTSVQIAAWANEIETATQAAFDDKAITASTADLLRFGKVTTANIRPAMVVMTDLAARTGDVQTAGKQLAKALADPTKASGSLRKAGIVLTKQQQKQIDAMVKAGDVAGAQRRVLEELAKTTGGAAANSVGKYGDAIHLMEDASEDAKKALAEGFFPVIERASGKITKLANDPKVIDGLRSFGSNLADAFDSAIDFAEEVDWKGIGAGLQSAADWAGRLFGAFNSMPAEAKGIILALAGLTKLTGGAPIKFALDFGKEALSGVFGHFFDRGSSAGNPLWVKTAGVSGLGDGTGTGSGGGKLGKALAGASIIGDIAAVVATQQAVSAENSAIASDIHAALSEGIKTKTPAELITALNGVNQGINDIQANPLNVLVSGSALDELRAMRASLAGQLGNAGTGANFATHGGDRWKGDSEVADRVAEVKTAAVGTSEAVNMNREATVRAQDDAKRAVASAVNVGSGRTSNAATGAGSRVTSQSIGNTSRIVGAIGSIPSPIVNVYNDVDVSATGVTRAQTTVSRTSRTSSRTADGYNDAGR